MHFLTAQVLAHPTLNHDLDIDNEDYSQFIEDTSQLPILNDNDELVIEEEPEREDELTTNKNTQRNN